MEKLLDTNFLFHVNADALGSVLNRAPDPLELGCHWDGYVNLVSPQEVNGKFPEDSDEEGIECIEDLNVEDEDETWMKAKANHLIPDFYGLFTDPEMWYACWQSRPNVCSTQVSE